MTLAVLDALDSARTQWYHITAIVTAGMGFFTDAYDLFCISTVAKLLGRLYYFDPDSSKPGKLPHNVNNMVIGVALVGTLTDQLLLVFGWLGDKLGRKKVNGFTLILMVICAICSGLSIGSTPKSVMNTPCFFRCWLGFGIGGDYPLSATIMSEHAKLPTKELMALSLRQFLPCKAWELFLRDWFLCCFQVCSYQPSKVPHTKRIESCPHHLKLTIYGG